MQEEGKLGNWLHDKVFASIEYWIEKYNSILQLFIIVALSVANALYVTNSIDVEKINVTIWISITMEIVILAVKDSSMHRKINDMGEIVRNMACNLPEKNQDLKVFFEDAKTDIFISGMVLDTILNDYEDIIENKLKEGVKVKLLLIDSESININAKYLYGSKYTNICDKTVYGRISNTLRMLENMDYFEKYIIDGSLEIRFVSGVMPMSILMADYDMNQIHLDYGKSKNMYVRTYVYGCDSKSNTAVYSPTIPINSNLSFESYQSYVKSTLEWWEQCKSERNIIELHKYINGCE